MIIRATAPLRLGLAGGGTDVSPFCDLYGGSVLNVTINMFAYCTIEPLNNGKIIFDVKDREEYQEVDMAKSIDYSDNIALLHKGVYNRIVKDYNDNEPLSFKMTTYSDAPVGSGLGSSSTMVVCIIKAFVEWLNLPLGEYDIAKLAYSVEREDLQLAGGKQDQYAAAFGGFNFMEFEKNNNVIVNSLKIKNWIKNEIENELVLYYTGTSRESAKIIKEQIINTKNNKQVSIDNMLKLKQSALDMKNSLIIADFEGIARILNESWLAKRKIARSISNKEIDELYEFVMNNGARAAKISGAGGGGFMMILCDPCEKFSLVAKLKNKGGIVMTPTIYDDGPKAWTLYD